MMLVFAQACHHELPNTTAEQRLRKDAERIERVVQVGEKLRSSRQMTFMVVEDDTRGLLKIAESRRRVL
jgi:hypothetical protein